MRTSSIVEIVNWLEGEIKGTEQYVRGAAQQIADDGAELTKQLTNTRPSKKSGKQGRVDTGRMFDAITSKVEQEGDTIVARYGMLDDTELYMALQTVTGFIHNRSGEFIEPTFALQDAFQNSIEQVDALLKDMKNGV